MAKSFDLSCDIDNLKHFFNNFNFEKLLLILLEGLGWWKVRNLNSLFNITINYKWVNKELNSLLTTFFLVTIHY